MPYLISYLKFSISRHHGAAEYSRLTHRESARHIHRQSVLNMDTSAAIDLASTIQSTSIEPHPDPAHDLNPSTTASSKIPVQLSTPLTSSAYTEIDRDIDGSLSDELSDGIEEDDIPFEVLKPLPRKTNLPPLPDMRFEQSYLKSIDHVKDRPWMVALITLRDQLVLPFVQGSVYSLALLGWRYWNRAAALSGDGVGARVRRWWYVFVHPLLLYLRISFESVLIVEPQVGCQ